MGDAWRERAKELMWAVASREAKRRTGSENPVFSYRWEHVTVVVRLAVKLAGLVGADVEVVEAAAWLHDVAKQVGPDHPAEGARFAARYLADTDFPAEKIPDVTLAIEEHMGLWRNSPLTNLESMVLWDADKLSKIGLTAAFHWTGLAFSKGKPVTIADLIAKSKAVDWQSKTVASMHTKFAREAAESRLEAYRQLWDALEAELEADDLAGPELN